MALVSILDVGHGSCVSLLADDGKQWLFDCGHDGDFRPSSLFKGETIHRLFFLNYDEDHISDLPELQRNCAIKTFAFNASITPHQLAGLKIQQSGELSAAMKELLVMRGWLNDDHGAGLGPIPPAADLQAEGVGVTTFCNLYGSPDPARGFFADTNNLSLVVFLHVHDLHMVLPGDLEKPGWEALLRNPYFRAELARVNVFVAGHHGRENGYCAEVFNYCSPEIVVMSDGEKKHSTQEMASTYGRHASGLQINGRNRSVLTTRNDGTIWFKASPLRTVVEIAPVQASPWSPFDELLSVTAHPG